VTAWERLSSVPPLRDEHGTIVLEEIDDDTRTATFRVYGRSSLTATLTPAGELVFDADPPPALLAAASVEGSDPLILRSHEQHVEGSDPSTLRSGRGKWVAAGVACGIAAIAVRRRR
jgi:hypothetical protein